MSYDFGMSEQTFLPSNPIEELLKTWDIDSVINETEPGAELLKIPALHAKYVRVLSKHSLLSKKADQDLIKLKRQKYDYYNGRMDQEELQKLGLKPFKFVLKGEVKDYVESDKEILDQQRVKAVHDEMVQLCQSILKELNSRTWQLRSYMEWERFIAGQ